MGSWFRAVPPGAQTSSLKLTGQGLLANQGSFYGRGPDNLKPAVLGREKGKADTTSDQWTLESSIIGLDGLANKTHESSIEGLGTRRQKKRK